MITTQKIIDFVNVLLYEKHPECTVYIQTLPKDYRKPAICIEVTSQGSEDNNISLIDEEVTLQIIYSMTPDNKHISTKTSLIAVSDSIKSVFKFGYITVENRTLRISSLTGGPGDNDIYISVTFNYIQERPVIEASYVVASEVKINQQEAG